jgi:hypothetical protein
VEEAVEGWKPKREAAEEEDERFRKDEGEGCGCWCWRGWWGDVEENEKKLPSSSIDVVEEGNWDQPSSTVMLLSPFTASSSHCISDFLLLLR